jgi:two-component system cell cycle response regulator DivK
MPAESPAREPKASCLRVLIVEDDANNRDLAQRIVHHAGYATLLAADGRQALAVAEVERPDLILMDLSLPEMDGWQATRLLKARPELARVPIVALTANAMAGDEARARAAGCDAYLPKPYKPRDLLHILATHLPAAS